MRIRVSLGHEGNSGISGEILSDKDVNRGGHSVSTIQELDTASCMAWAKKELQTCPQHDRENSLGKQF